MKTPLNVFTVNKQRDWALEIKAQCFTFFSKTLTFLGMKIVERVFHLDKVTGFIQAWPSHLHNLLHNYGTHEELEIS